MRSYKTILRFAVLLNLALAVGFGQGLTITAEATNPANLVVGEGYQGTGGPNFSATGGTEPYSFTFTGIPPGLSPAASGAGFVGGIPTTAGIFNMTVTVTDSSPTPLMAQQTFPITVVAAPLVMVPPGGILTGGTLNTSYSATLYARYGTPPYTWSVVQGTPPPGLNYLSTTSAYGSYFFTPVPSELGGTSTIPGTFSFTLQVQDSATPPQTVAKTFSLSVINLNSFADGTYNQPDQITAADGALWFTQRVEGSGVAGIESVSTAGQFSNETLLTVHPPPPAAAYPAGITAGPDGNFWVTDSSSGYIYQIPVGGSQQAIELLTSAGDPVFPTGIASGGSEGGVWFAAAGGFTPGVGWIGQIDPSNLTVQYYQIPQAASYPTSIVLNPLDNNALWFLDQAGDPANPASQFVVIGRIVPGATPSQQPSFQAPTGCRQMANTAECLIPGTTGHVASGNNGRSLISVDSQGTVWFATADQIGSISRDGSVVNVYPLPVPASGSIPFQITSIAVGSDGAIWYLTNNTGSSYVGRVAPSGAVTLFQVQGSVEALTTGPDKALWITAPIQSTVFQLLPPLGLTCPNIPYGTLQIGLPIPANTSCAAFGGRGPFTLNYDQSKLPAGVSVNTTPGVISGTPTAAGSLTITASDSSSPPQQANQIISFVPAPAINLSCTLPSSGTAGQPYSGSCAVSGGTQSGTSGYTFAIAPVAPTTAGQINWLTGTPTGQTSTPGVYGFQVTGTPTSYGSLTFTITATDSVGNMSAPQQITVTIAPPPVSFSCSSNMQAVVGKAFQQTCYGAAGAPPYTFAATGLPAGLSIGSTTGLIVGTPTAPGQHSVSVTLTDSTGQTATQAINLSVLNPQLALVCSFPASASTGTLYSSTCKTYGGVGPYSYSISAVPARLTFNSANGTVSGKPATAGLTTFTLQVTDSESPAASAQQIVNLVVHSTALAITTANLPTPSVSFPYAARIFAEGGTPPYTFTVTSGALPGGLQLDPHGAIASISGGTLATGAYSFTLQAADAAGAKATQAYSGTISASPLVQDFTPYALSSGGGANGIVAGTNSLWFTTLDQAGGNLIGNITTAGVITTQPAANALTNSSVAAGGDITIGPDGKLWIAERDGNTIGQAAVDLSSQLSYASPTPSSAPSQIAAAPDGTLWFTETAVSKVAHVDPAGNFTEIPLPSGSADPSAITAGPDNLIVFAEPGTNRIGFVSQDGTSMGDYAIPTANSLPTSIVLGPDQAFWFTESGANKIGRMDFAGNMQEVAVSASPQAITVGPDGALYFTETDSQGNGDIGRVNVGGVLTEIPIPDANSGPAGIATGPDGAIWFAEKNLSKIVRLSFVLAPTVTCTLPTGPLVAGDAFAGTCTASQGTPPYQFATGGLPGVSIDPKTGTISGNVSTAGTFTFEVQVTDGSIPPATGAESVKITVTPKPLTLTCNLPIARLYGAYSAGCSAANGTPPYTFALSGTLPPEFSFSTTTGVITATSVATLGSFPITVTVTDSGTPAMVVSQAVTFSVQYGAVTKTGAPLFTISTPPESVNAGGNAPGLTLTANESLLQAVTGTATLSFTVYSGVASPSPDYVDPAMQFLDDKGNPTSATYNFTMQPGTSSVALPTFNVGSVAGTIGLAVSLDSATPPQAKTLLTVPSGPPQVEAGSVQFTNVTANSFDLEFVATSPLRSGRNAIVTINPASGSTILGQSSFVIDVSTVSRSWFSSAASSPYGGRYSLTIPFQFNGPINAITSATVVFMDGNGVSSDPVTGNR